MKRLLRSQRGGVALIMVLAFMALGTPVITSTLNLADSLSIDSRVKTDVLKRQYCALGVREYLVNLLKDQSPGGRWESLVADPPAGTGGVGSITCNGEQINFTVAAPALPPGAPDIALPDFLVTKTVTSPAPVPPATAAVVSAGGSVTYTITVQNQGDDPATLTKIFDRLPPGFGYVGPTTGAASLDPCRFQDSNLEIEDGNDIHCSVGSNQNVEIEDDTTISGDVSTSGGNLDVDEGAVVLGVVTASGNVEVSDNSTVGAAISWGGNVLIDEGSLVQGRVWAAGNVDIDGTVEGDATSSGGNVLLDENRIVLGDIWAQGNVTIKSGATVGSATSGGDITAITGNVTVEVSGVVWGDLWAAGNVVIKSNGQVKGSLYSGGDVTLEAGAVVTGNVSAVSSITEQGNPPQYCVGCTPPSSTPPVIPLDSSAERRGQALLTWNISPPVTLQPGAQVTLSFVAKAISTDGNYCNEAWVEPGGLATTTGLTAQVQVGAQAGACQTPVYLVSETVSPSILAVGDDPANGFTYSMVIDNTTGTDSLTLSKIQNLLPAGFEYVAFEVTIPPSWEASTTVTTSTFLQRELVNWRFDTPLVVAAGQSTTLDFEAEVTAPPLAIGENYWSEVWVTFDEKLQRVETGPTALVRVLGVYDGTTSDGTTESATFQIWDGADAGNITWVIN